MTETFKFAKGAFVNDYLCEKRVEATERTVLSRDLSKVVRGVRKYSGPWAGTRRLISGSYLSSARATGIRCRWVIFSRPRFLGPLDRDLHPCRLVFEHAERDQFEVAKKCVFRCPLLGVAGELN